MRKLIDDINNYLKEAETAKTKLKNALDRITATTKNYYVYLRVIKHALRYKAGPAIELMEVGIEDKALKAAKKILEEMKNEKERTTN